MQFTKTTSTQGAWVKAQEIESGIKAKLVSEAQAVDSGEYGVQTQAKIRIEGDSETKNVRVNKPSQNALIDAYGTDSKEWINKTLTIKTEEMRVGGKKVTALYLIPQSYQLIDDENGYLVIVPEVGVVKEQEIPIIEDGVKTSVPEATRNATDEVDIKDVPF